MNVDSMSADVPVEVVGALFEVGQQRHAALQAGQVSMRNGTEATVFEGAVQTVEKLGEEVKW